MIFLLRLVFVFPFVLILRLFRLAVLISRILLAISWSLAGPIADLAFFAAISAGGLTLWRSRVGETGIAALDSLPDAMLARITTDAIAVLSVAYVARTIVRVFLVFNRLVGPTPRIDGYSAAREGRRR